MELFVGILLVIGIYFLALTIITFPVWFLWNALVPTYFTGLPEKLQHLPFLDTMGFVILIGCIAGVLTGSFRVNTKTK